MFFHFGHVRYSVWLYKCLIACKQVSRPRGLWFKPCLEPKLYNRTCLFQLEEYSSCDSESKRRHDRCCPPRHLRRTRHLDNDFAVDGTKRRQKRKKSRSISVPFRCNVKTRLSRGYLNAAWRPVNRQIEYKKI